MVRLLVVSGASINFPHRKPYDMLARQTGWEVHIACPASAPLADGGVKRADPAPQDAKYRLHFLNVHRMQNGRLASFSQLGRILRTVKPDVAFVEYDPGSVPVLETFLLSRGKTRVISFTPENIDHPRWSQALENLRRANIKAALRDAGVAALSAAGNHAAHGLACVNSEGQRIFAKRWGNGRPIEVMPLGTDLTLFKPIDSSRLRTSLGLGNSFVVGYIGRLVPEKGVDLLIEALGLLPKDVHLLLDMFKNFAPGSYAARILQQAKDLSVLDRIVTFDVPHENVPEYINCCDVIVVPSRTSERWKEQFGRVIPEAMACGVPVIGTNSGNIPEAIGDAGVIVSEGSAQQLADAVLRLKANPAERKELIDRGLRWVRDHLSVECQVQVLQRLVQDVLAR